MKRLLLIAALVPAVSHAEFWDGNRLFQRIESASMYDQGTAMGYIMGVADVLHGVVQCAPANVTAGQVSDMVRNYLANVPAERNQTADMLVARVLKAAWPCPATQRRGNT